MNFIDIRKCMQFAKDLDPMPAGIYRYLNFDLIESFQKNAEDGKRIAAEQIVEVA